MLNGRDIELFLSKNSSVSNAAPGKFATRADLKTKYRPDKIFYRDEYMKWDMIFNGIDTPYRMASGSTHMSIDRTWLKTELNELDDFKI